MDDDPVSPTKAIAGQLTWDSPLTMALGMGRHSL